ncbi:MAG: PaaR repeat-containing protein [Polyangiaceae bacterium]|nr:PaaR repeat-containing protein [Polyangiaceae bacterium]
MPSVSTKVDLCKGHDACAPRPMASFSPDVWAEGFEVAREDDSLVPHGCPNHPPHGANISAGYPTVFANGKPVGYIGASVSWPSGEMGTGRPSVFVGERAGG